MKTIQNFFCTFCLLAIFSVTTFAAGVPLNTLKGKYKNENRNTRSITKINLQVSGTAVKVHAFGSCSPTDCDWGKVNTTVFSGNVSQSPTISTEAILAVYDKGFAKTHLVITPMGQNRIRVRILTKFKNGSRKDYSSVQTFKKVAGAQKLPAPSQISPCGQTFNHYPRKTNLRWRPVQGAVKYIVEVDCMHCCATGKWCYDLGQKWKKETTTRTNYSFNFVGAQPGRWRVTAVDRNGKKGKTSKWCNFKYTR